MRLVEGDPIIGQARSRLCVPSLSRRHTELTHAGARLLGDVFLQHLQSAEGLSACVPMVVRARECVCVCVYIPLLHH